jgi:hypothetical protein
MKLFYLISGLLFTFGSLIIIKYQLPAIETYKTGNLIEAKVLYVPNCITTKIHYNMKFEYNDNIYAKEIGGLRCKELNVGETLKLKTNSNNSVFLYENENPYSNLISSFVLLGFGLFLLILGLKKK